MGKNYGTLYLYVDVEEVKLFVKGIDVPAPHWVTTLDREEISMELISFMQVQLASEQRRIEHGANLADSKQRQSSKFCLALHLYS